MDEQQAETIINEMIERGDNMTLCVGANTLQWDKKAKRWQVHHGYYANRQSIFFIGDDFWQAFAALCGATKQRSEEDEDN